MDDLLGQQIKGYEIKERIAAGGFGAVYRAQQSTVGREVAMKVILPGLANRPDFVRRFDVEAQVVARLEHHFIVPLYDYWRDPDGAYLVMRYLRGGNLHDYIRQHGALRIEEAFVLLSQVAQALHVAHRNQVVHRDIKPGNILLDEDGNGFLADFGIAKDPITSLNMTEPDSFIGSPDYLAPEQARSEPVTPHTDIYSLGVVLYEMLAGDHPFPNLEKIEVIFKHLNEPLPYISTLDDHICDDVNRVIEKATAKDPNQRFGDVIELVEALRQAAQLDMPVTPISPVELLTPREQEVMQLIMAGKTNREIADLLVLTEGTIRTYITRIYRKLNVRSRVQAIARVRDLDFVIQRPEAASTISTEDLPEPDNPYKGLRAFQAADAPNFFGREKLTLKLLSRLQENVEHSRFLSIVGPSGSGKSSVVYAGLIPALWRGNLPGSENWYIVDFLPGANPIDELEISLLRITTDKSLNLREQLQRDDRGLLRVADLILPDDGSELLIVIDQFEELFTLVESEDERLNFLNLVRKAVSDNRSRVRVVVTLRADYYDRPLQYPDFGELMRNRVETVLPLRVEELEKAIEEPANQINVDFEDGLVSRIISDVHYQPGALPLLQYALTELFERRDGRMLTLEAYQDIGGTGGALAKRADEIYLEGNDDWQEIVRQLFLRLVTLGEGAEDTRRRVVRSDLLAMTSNPELMDEIIDLYTDSRLLSLDHDPASRRPTVEVAHEAILREWDRLRSWLNENRDDIRQERSVAQAADAWSYNNQDESYLLTGSRLEQAEAWHNTTALALTPLENAFVQASLKAASARQLANAERQAREEKQEQRSRSLLQALVAVFAIAAVFSIGFGIFAFAQQRLAQSERDIAQRQADENQSLVWAFQARENINTNYPLALRLALESVNIENPPTLAESTFRAVLNDDALAFSLNAHSQSISSISATRDGQIILSASCAELAGDMCLSGEIAAWDTVSRSEMWRIESHGGWVNSVLIDADADSVLAAGCGVRNRDEVCSQGELIRYDLQTGDLLETSTIYSNELTTLFRISDVEYLIGTTAGTILMWDEQDSDISMTFEGHTAPVRHLAVTSEGSQLLSGDDDGVLILRTLEDDQIIWNIQGHDNALTGLHIVASGRSQDKFAITTGADFQTRRWDMSSGEMIDGFSSFSVPCCPLPHAENGQVYIMVDEGGSKRSVSNMTVELDEFGTHSWYSEFVNADDQDASPLPSAAYYVPETHTIILGNHAGNLKIWVMANAPMSSIQGTSYFAADINPANTRLALVTTFGTIEIWDINPASPTYLTQVMTIENDLQGTGWVFYDSEGTHLIWGVNDYFVTGESRLYYVDAVTGEILERFDASQHLATLRNISFSMDETRIVSGSQPANGDISQRDVIVWDIDTGALLAQYVFDEDVTDIAAFDNERVLLTSAEGENVRLLNIETGEIEQLYDASYSTFSTHYLSDSQRIVAGLGNGSISLWNTTNSSAIETIAIEGEEFYNSDISSDGRYIALTGKNHITVVDMEAGTVVNQFTHNIDLWAVAFSPDNKSVWSADFEGAIHQWLLSNQPIDALKSWAYDNRFIHELTCEERLQYHFEPPCSDT